MAGGSLVKKDVLLLCFGFMGGYLFFYSLNRTSEKTLKKIISMIKSSEAEESKKERPQVPQAPGYNIVTGGGKAGGGGNVGGGGSVGSVGGRDEMVESKPTVPQKSPKDGAFYPEAELAKDDEDWEKKTCEYRELVDQADFYNYIDTRVLHCEKPAMFGGGMLKTVQPPIFAGEKWVCLSKKYNIIDGKCLIYSFGVDHDWTFDDDIDKKYNCKVLAFDPTLGVEDHNRTSNIKFFNLGISNISNRGPGVKKKMDRYINILKMMGHTNTVIDYLKLDVEGAERMFFDDVLFETPNALKNVKMIAMEIHHQGRGLGADQKRFWKYFQRLDCLGFKVWFSEINPWPPLHFWFRGQIKSCCYEIVWARDRQW